MNEFGPDQHRNSDHDAVPNLAQGTFSAQMVSYKGVADRIVGKRDGVTTYSHQRVASAYTWNPQADEWLTDTIVLGLSKAGLRYFSATEAHVSPIEGSTLDKIVRSTMLGGCRGRPDKLFEILSSYPSAHPVSDISAVSAPIPLYHDSGMFKDVYLFLQLVLPPIPDGTMRELPLALKIAKNAGSISRGELEFHDKLHRAQERKRIVSATLGFFDLNEFPELKMPGRIVSLEAFEPGAVCGKYIARGWCSATAKKVTDCVLSLMELSCKAGFGRWDWGFYERGSAGASLLRAKFPSDINWGNFVINPSGRAVLVDPGEHHPQHTAPEILLRLIYNYWTHEGSGRNFTSPILPLAPLFSLISKHFGEEKGSKILLEFRTTLGFLIGTPIDELRRRFSGVPVDDIGQNLRRTLAEDSELGSTRYISTAVREQRTRYFAKLQQLAADGEYARHESLRFSTRALPLLFSDRKLHTIASELDAFLAAQQAVAPSAALLGAERFKRQTQIGSGALTKALSEQLPLGEANFSVSGRLGNELVRGALYVTPFPDPAIVRLAMIVAEFRRWRDPKILNQENWRRYEEVTLSCASLLHNIFEDRGFTESAADLVGQNIGVVFVSAAQALHHTWGSTSPAEFRNLMRQWLSVLTALEVVYTRDGGNAALMAVGAAIDWEDINKALIAERPDKIIRHLMPAYNPEESGNNFGAYVEREIAAGSERLATILTTRYPPRQIHAIPRFVVINPGKEADAGLST